MMAVYSFERRARKLTKYKTVMVFQDVRNNFIRAELVAFLNVQTGEQLTYSYSFVQRKVTDFTVFEYSITRPLLTRNWRIQHPIVYKSAAENVF